MALPQGLLDLGRQIFREVAQAIENDLMKLGEDMTKLTTKAREKIPKKEFGLPAEKKYPLSDRAHAANAKARASEMEKKGKLSESQKEKIDAKANKVLKKKK